jgi:hypothetical protein
MQSWHHSASIRVGPFHIPAQKSAFHGPAATRTGSAVSVSRAAMVAFPAFQLGNQSRLGECFRGGEDDRVFVFVVPKLLEADWLRPFQCHGVNVVHFSLCWQGPDG